MFDAVAAPQLCGSSFSGGGPSSSAMYGVGTSVAAPASRREARLPQPASKSEPRPRKLRLEIVIDLATASRTDRRTEIVRRGAAHRIVRRDAAHRIVRPKKTVRCYWDDEGAASSHGEGA